MKIFSPILAFLVFILLIAVPPGVLAYTGNSALLADNFWTLFIFISCLTLLLVTGMLAAKQKNQEYFTAAFLGGTTIKLLACIVFLFVFMNKNIPQKHVFLVDFIYVYLLNTGFEVYILLRNLRHENSR